MVSLICRCFLLLLHWFSLLYTVLHSFFIVFDCFHMGFPKGSLVFIPFLPLAHPPAPLWVWIVRLHWYKSMKSTKRPWKSNTKQWKVMKSNASNGAIGKSNEILMKSNENQWKSFKLQWKVMKTDERPIKTMEKS